MKKKTIQFFLLGLLVAASLASAIFLNSKSSAAANGKSSPAIFEKKTEADAEKEKAPALPDFTVAQRVLELVQTLVNRAN